ncbi:MAG: conjugal transfer protein TraN [Simkaniaceae bacterium]|nr:conjugal transfer protein TraN [Simkaniaceae bacterium]
MIRQHITWPLYFFSLATIFPLNAFDSKKALKPLMKESNSAAKSLAKKERLTLLRSLKKANSSIHTAFSEDDLLPSKDKGLVDSFTPPEETPFSHIEQEFEEFLSSNQKREQFEEAEAIFTTSNLAISDPSKQLSIVQEENLLIPEEETLAICQEGSRYEVVIKQQLSVVITPEIIQSIAKCGGHENTFLLEQKDEVKQVEDHWKKLLFRDKTLQNHHIAHKKQGKFHKIVVTWNHHDNVKCDNYHIEEKILKKRQEKDFWHADRPNVLSHTQSHPNCRLLFEQTIEGPQTRIIQDVPIYRDKWGRNLLFSCDNSQNNKCQHLRDQGGVLIKKQCLQKNSLEECDLWEKTYDIGRQAEQLKTNVTFAEDSLWGLNELDSSYEQNKDFGEVVTRLSIISDLNNELPMQDFDPNTATVFSGTASKCQRSFAKELYDCCRKLEGLAIDTHLACCTEEEKDLASKRNDGKCHYIGSKDTKLGLETEQVFCCFPTKLSRLLQEEGRKQLNIKWGTAECPKCQGLSLKELQLLDFSKMDLSEVVDDMSGKISKQDLLHKIKSLTNTFQTSTSEFHTKQVTDQAVRETESIQQQGGPL